MEIDVNKSLNIFLDDRKDRFKNVTDKQKKVWVKAIEENIIMTLEDNDIFYDWMPEDVVESDEYIKTDE